MSFNLSIYFILTPSLCLGRPIEDIATAAVKGGATLLQLRDKTDQALENAKKLKALNLPIPLIINDHVEIAATINADGAHIGQGDISATEARAILGPGKILGVTAFTPGHIAAINPKIVDYIGTGPFFPTKTDKNKPILGPEKFAKLAALSPVPVVAIGGITPQNAHVPLSNGANGLAIMRAISEAKDVELAAKQFKIVIHDT